ncbi:MAG: ABC transporter permease [Deltaproteobacteria bacterium]|nr:MAG: ABC transporter permease [Deltaproteobacteria bacterium]
MLIKLAFRNMFRNKKRSILSMLTVIVGVMGMILAYGLARGVEETTIRVDMETDFGHLRVMNKKYKEDEANLPLDLPVHQPNTIIQRIQGKWPNAVAFPRVVFKVDLSDGQHSLRCRGVALPPDAAEKAYRFSQYGQRKVKLAENENSIFLGAELAKTFEKKVGERLTLLVRTRAGSMNALDFTIRDIIATGNMLVDGNTVLMSLNTGRKLLQMPKGATDVIAWFPNKEVSVQAASLVQKISTQNYPRTWQNKYQDIIELQKADRMFYNALIAIIMLVAAIGIANTLLMSGYERQGEIGMMMAQGMQNHRIIQMFAAEAAFLGFFGSLFGLLLGAPLAFYFQANGISIPGGAEMLEGTTMSISTTIYFSVSVQLLVFSVVLGVGISVLGSLWPAWRFTRLKPIEALTKG